LGVGDEELDTSLTASIPERAERFGLQWIAWHHDHSALRRWSAL